MIRCKVEVGSPWDTEVCQFGGTLFGGPGGTLIGGGPSEVSGTGSHDGISEVMSLAGWVSAAPCDCQLEERRTFPSRSSAGTVSNSGTRETLRTELRMLLEQYRSPSRCLCWRISDCFRPLFRC